MSKPPVLWVVDLKHLLVVFAGTPRPHYRVEINQSLPPLTPLSVLYLLPSPPVLPSVDPTRLGSSRAVTEEE